MQGYANLPVAVHSPFWDRTHGRPVYISYQQYRLIAKVQTGWRGTQRALAAELGYSLAGLNESVASLSRLGILGRLSRRGRLGWTCLYLQRGARALRKLNVRTVVEQARYARLQLSVKLASLALQRGLRKNVVFRDGGVGPPQPSTKPGEKEMRTFGAGEWKASEAAWSDFGFEWRDVKRVALEQGILMPPKGSGEDQREDPQPSQRAIVYQAMTDRPRQTLEIVSRSRSWFQVVERIIQAEARLSEAAAAAEEKAAEEKAALAPSTQEAKETFGEIMRRHGYYR